MRYTSPIRVAGLPLLCVVLENPVNKSIFEAEPAIGIVAVGQNAYGVIIVSQFGAGVFCVSQLLYPGVKQDQYLQQNIPE